MENILLTQVNNSGGSKHSLTDTSRSDVEDRTLPADSGIPGRLWQRCWLHMLQKDLQHEPTSWHGKHMGTR